MFHSMQYWLRLPPNIGALTAPMHGQYNFTYSITRNCNITRPLLTPLKHCQHKPFYYVFVYFQFQWSISVYDFSKCRFLGAIWIFWFILYRSAKVALKLSQKLGRDKQSKMHLKISVFLPLIPPIYIFQIYFFFINADHVEWNRMAFELWKSVR